MSILSWSWRSFPPSGPSAICSSLNTGAFFLPLSFAVKFRRDFSSHLSWKVLQSASSSFFLAVWSTRRFTFCWSGITALWPSAKAFCGWTVQSASAYPHSNPFWPLSWPSIELCLFALSQNSALVGRASLHHDVFDRCPGHLVRSTKEIKFLIPICLTFFFIFKIIYEFLFIFHTKNFKIHKNFSQNFFFEIFFFQNFFFENFFSKFFRKFFENQICFKIGLWMNIFCRIFFFSFK